LNPASITTCRSKLWSLFRKRLQILCKHCRSNNQKCLVFHWTHRNKVIITHSVYPPKLLVHPFHYSQQRPQRQHCKSAQFTVVSASAYQSSSVKHWPIPAPKISSTLPQLCWFYSDGIGWAREASWSKLLNWPDWDKKPGDLLSSDFAQPQAHGFRPNLLCCAWSQRSQGENCLENQEKLPKKDSGSIRADKSMNRVTESPINSTPMPSHETRMKLWKFYDRLDCSLRLSVLCMSILTLLIQPAILKTLNIGPPS